MSFQAQRYLTLGQVPVSQGNDHPLICPYGTFEAQDGLFNLAVGTDDQWRKLCSAQPRVWHNSVAPSRGDPAIARTEGLLALFVKPRC